MYVLETGCFINRAMTTIHYFEPYTNTPFVILPICCLNCYVLEYWNTYFEVLQTNYVAEICS